MSVISYPTRTRARTRWRRARAAPARRRGKSRRSTPMRFWSISSCSTSKIRRFSAGRPITSPTRSRSSPTSRRTATPIVPPTESTSTRANNRTTVTSRGSTSKGWKRGNASTWARSAIRPTSRCGNSRRPAKSGKWNGTAPWGRGFPGWHIECSAMAQRYLGDFFDIHCGGEDHIPVHHTNEIAQTEARVGTHLANFWMHGYFLLLKDAKMAKSAGEFLRLQSLIERGYDPLAYRYLCLTGHYRSQLNFTWEALDAAATGLDRMRQAAFAMEGDAGASPSRAFTDRFTECTNRFTDCINGDLNVPRALAVAWELIRGGVSGPAQAKARLTQFDRVFGLALERWSPGVVEGPDRIKQLADARAEARKDRNWA